MKISISGMINPPSIIDGYCPLCGAPVRMHMAEMDQCWNGHIYPAAQTNAPSTQHYSLGDKVKVKPKRAGYVREGTVVEEKNEEGLIGVELVGATPNAVGDFINYYPKELLQKA